MVSLAGMTIFRSSQQVIDLLRVNSLQSMGPARPLPKQEVQFIPIFGMGTAADIASCNLIGVYPVIGWWRERGWLQRWDRKARYSLIVSLHTPDEHIDIYTPVAVQLGVPVQIVP